MDKRDGNERERKTVRQRQKEKGGKKRGRLGKGSVIILGQGIVVYCV